MYIILRGSVGIYRLPEERRILEEEASTNAHSTTTTTTASTTTSTSSASSTIDIAGQTNSKEPIRQQLGERVAGLGSLSWPVALWQSKGQDKVKDKENNEKDKVMDTVSGKVKCKVIRGTYK